MRIWLHLVEDEKTRINSTLASSRWNLWMRDAVASLSSDDPPGVFKSSIADTASVSADRLWQLGEDGSSSTFNTDLSEPSSGSEVSEHSYECQETGSHPAVNTPPITEYTDVGPSLCRSVCRACGSVLNVWYFHCSVDNLAFTL